MPDTNAPGGQPGAPLAPWNAFADMMRVDAIAMKIMRDGISGIGTVAYGEPLNMVRSAWTSSDLMTVLPDTGIGLAPSAQWIVIPILAFAAARSAHLLGHLDLPTMGTPTSGVTPDHLARSGRRAS